MENVTEIFGSQVFNDRVMQDRLPRETYRALQKTVETGAPLDRETANVVANSMKKWAIENGATHYTHWFQPMTGTTAEKHDSFINPDGKGNVIMEFSGKELIKGEPDASSFPSGGIRATFEARGYTAWDPSSYAFVKDGSLYIPTAFCSYNGEALDTKTPLLRSMEAIEKEALHILQLFGRTDVKRVLTTVGAEQEYFIVSKEMYNRRPDLVLTGRTLFGAKPPKGQELDDQYFGQLKPKIAEYMADLDETLWRLGISAKTKHNEAAPAQHEMAPVFATTNVAADHNQLTMEMMKKVADRHGLVCLLHEKPFAGVNGSGKHNNWSMSTDSGENLFNPGKTPHENAQFLLFLAAVIKAVDDYQDLLRISVASAGNDHRLGANEAPPAIVSMFLGEELENVLDAIATGEDYCAHERVLMDLGVALIPKFKKDTTDRNRTSSFAFTGNKFEFRMPGSSQSISVCNTTINTIVAATLRTFSEKLDGSQDMVRDVMNIVKETYKAHKRVIFNGNGYALAWEDEAARRGLSNLRTTPQALPHMLDERNVDVFSEFSVFSRSELEARYEIYTENYCTTITIEANTMADIIRRRIYPAVIAYETQLTDLIAGKQQLGVPGVLEKSLLSDIAIRADSMYAKLNELDAALLGAKEVSGTAELGEYYHDSVFVCMQELRAIVDELETLVGDKYWPLPSYAELINSVN